MHSNSTGTSTIPSIEWSSVPKKTCVKLHKNKLVITKSRRKILEPAAVPETGKLDIDETIVFLKAAEAERNEIEDRKRVENNLEVEGEHQQGSFLSNSIRSLHLKHFCRLVSNLKLKLKAISPIIENLLSLNSPTHSSRLLQSRHMIHNLIRLRTDTNHVECIFRKSALF